MIISHRHKFIYLRTEKTASTSLTDALSKIVAQDDEVVKSFSGKWVDALPFHPGKLKRLFPGIFGLHPHASARHVRQIVGAKIFDSYFKFAVERNPWERQVSLYHHREFKRKNQNPDFDRDMRSPGYRFSHHTRLHNWDIYAIDGKVVTDQVLAYETLARDLPAVTRKLGIGSGIELPRRNVGYGGKRAHYSTYYSDETRSLIERWYRREIATFGYEFDDQRGPAAAPKN